MNPNTMKGASFQPMPTKSVAEFLPSSRDGDNETAKGEFLRVAQFILSSSEYATFGLDTFASLSRGCLGGEGIPADKLKSYFAAWTKKLCLEGILEPVAGCYSTPVFKRTYGKPVKV